MNPVCPFVKAPRPNDASSMKSVETLIATNSNKQQQEVEAKCPFGYDSKTFKIGPLSCMICQALLFQSSKCQPCSHSFCKECISRFKDCPLCGADIEKIEEDENLQSLVDRFIDGHARIKRTHVDDNAVVKVKADTNKKVIYEDVSLDRGAFLVQQAMRAFRAQNIGSAKSRLRVCAEDIRDQLQKVGNSSELCSQLGAVLVEQQEMLDLQ